MTALHAIQAIATAASSETLTGPATNLAPLSKMPEASFGQLIANGIHQVDNKLAVADKLVNAFLLDDSIPVHQVTFALEQARLSVELMLQVRGRLLEAYQQFMGMQL